MIYKNSPIAKKYASHGAANQRSGIYRNAFRLQHVWRKYYYYQQIYWITTR